jgi:hypothetical protein
VKCQTGATRTAKSVKTDTLTISTSLLFVGAGVLAFKPELAGASLTRLAAAFEHDRASRKS